MDNSIVESIEFSVEGSLEKNLVETYNLFLSDAVNATSDVLENQSRTIIDKMNSKLLPILLKQLTEHVEKLFAVSPGRGKLGLAQKQQNVQDRIIHLEKIYLKNYFYMMKKRVTDAVLDSITKFINTPLDLKDVVPTYELGDPKDSMSSPQLNPKDLDDDVNDPIEADEHTNLIFNGPLDAKDITYNKFVKTNSQLKSYEHGYTVVDFNKQSQLIDLKKEFETLGKITFDSELSKNLVRVENDNKKLNRYSDVIPYSKNIVRLPQGPYGINHYINASYTSSCIKDDKKAFISTQGPLDNTIEDFWNMVVNEKVEMIVMLCKYSAGSRPQCAEYFPETSSKDYTFKNMVISIVKTETVGTSLYRRTFNIKLADGSKREITHLQWKGWPDNGVPEQNQYDQLLYLVKEILIKREKSLPPIIVHCSAGVGRTGTLIAIHNLAQIIKAYVKTADSDTSQAKNMKLSVFSVVRRLREERTGMVQTLEQYELVYQFARMLIANPKNWKPPETAKKKLVEAKSNIWSRSSQKQQQLKFEYVGSNFTRLLFVIHLFDRLLEIAQIRYDDSPFGDTAPEKD